MFQEAYKKAYDNIVPKQELLLKIEEQRMTKEVQGEAGCLWQSLLAGKAAGVVLYPMAAVIVMVLLLGVTATPVLAKEFPFVYRIVEKYAPSLAEYILPLEYSCSKAGIKMQVEAIQVEDKEAQVIVSFTDEPGYDYVNGKVDMYDSYHLTSYSGESNVGGSSFLEYNAMEDKAYFKLDMSSWDTFDKEKVRFHVNMLLTNCVEEIREVNLSQMDASPSLKEVTLSGAGGSMNNAKLQEYLGKSESEPWRRGAKVLSGTYDATFVDKLEITAVGYEDGILRIQNCRGAFAQADRHMNIMLIDEEGKERYCDYSVDWQEEIAGKNVSFNEQWFLISAEELEQMQVLAACFITDGCVEGGWEVIFTIDEVSQDIWPEE